MFKKLEKCRVCQKNIIPIIDFENQPLANSFHNKNVSLDNYPLKLMLCSYCFHLQLSIVVSPDILFKNYIYVSGTSNTSKKYFSDFCEIVLKNNEMKTKNVLDIACNDGSQLDPFKKKNYNTYGVDPAKNLYEISNKKGHNIICDYWNKEVSEKFNKIDFDIIIAQNVFAHVDDIYDFLNSCKNVMNNNTSLYIQTSQANIVETNQFDTVYHEHLSFFSTNSMKYAVENVGMYINNIDISSIHGGSYVFKINKYKDENSNVDKFIENETENGRYNLNSYIKYKNNCLNFRNNIKKMLEDLVNEGYKLIGFGAAAKANTLLNFCKIELEYIVDENELKQNLYSPGMNIIVKNMEYLIKDKDKKIIIPLAWNFSSEIKKKISNNKVENYGILEYYPEIILTKNL